MGSQARGEVTMSMFMASMHQAARDGELDGLGMFGAALKQEVGRYEKRLEDDRKSRFAPTSPKGSDHE
jgi:hypothetical protein